MGRSVYVCVCIRESVVRDKNCQTIIAGLFHHLGLVSFSSSTVPISQRRSSLFKSLTLDACLRFGKGTLDGGAILCCGSIPTHLFSPQEFAGPRFFLTPLTDSHLWRCRFPCYGMICYSLFDLVPFSFLSVLACCCCGNLLLCSLAHSTTVLPIAHSTTFSVCFVDIFSA